jgi:transcriptional regulator with XRE-family HTH domain/Zn-dependent peptidase ImmA (M78 family)
MHRLIHSQTIKTALDQFGWTQKQLAEKIGVTPQAVTNWLKGVDFPRPDKLLKLALTLKLEFNQLIVSTVEQPIVAFRKKAGTKTTEQHLLKAISMGTLLRALLPFLPKQKALRTQIPSPSIDYDQLQSTACAVRAKLGIGAQATLSYQHLISGFEANDAVIVPVMWGQKLRHENALHILLPTEKITFIYINLDTHLEDFKFWMAHELAHVYTPELAGTDDGENFADAFAGALLFPRDMAHVAYTEAVRKHNTSGEVDVLQHHARTQQISLFSVFLEVSKYAHSLKLPPLRVVEKDIHAVRNSQRGSLVSEALFKPLPPAPVEYIAASNKIFQSPFFAALRIMLRESGAGVGYVQQLLDITLKDATALHFELKN